MTPQSRGLLIQALAGLPEERPPYMSPEKVTAAINSLSEDDMRSVLHWFAGYDHEATGFVLSLTLAEPVCATCDRALVNGKCPVHDD